MRITCVAAAALVFLPAAAAQANTTVQDLRRGCMIAADGVAQVSDEDLFIAGLCLGLAAGVGQLLDLNCYRHREGTSLNPEWLRADMSSSSFGARAQAFVNWSNGNPDKWEWDLTLGMISALTETFPCTN